MKRKILNSLLVLGITFGITGCTHTGDNLTLPTNNNKKIQKEMFYKDTIVKQEVDEKEFANNIIPTFDYNKKYAELKYYDCISTGQCHISGTTTRLENESIGLYFILGIGQGKSNPVENEKIFDVNNHDVYRSVAKFQIPFKYESKGSGKFHVQASFPETFYNHIAGRFGFNNFQSAASVEHMKEEAKKSFTNLENIQIKRVLKVDAEVNSKFDNKSIEANFQRKLLDFDNAKIRNANFIYQMEQKEFEYLARINPYVIEYKNELFPITYKIYPYQNGTKVVYTLYVSYKLNSDGTATLTDKDIDLLKQKIENLVND